MSDNSQQFFLPISVGAPVSGTSAPSPHASQPMPAEPVNVVGPAQAYFSLAESAEREGQSGIAQYLLSKSIEAEKSGGSTGAYLPGVHAPQGKAVNVGNPLAKSLLRNAMRPKTTQHRINEALIHLGAYTGVREPEQATKFTFEYLERISKMPYPQAIMRNRINRALPFLRAPRHRRDTGWEIQMMDSKSSPSRAARKKMEQFTELFQFGGYRKLANGALRVNQWGQPGVYDGLGEEKAHGLAQLVPLLLRAMQTYDFAPFRMEPGEDARRFPVAFLRAVDAASISLTEPKTYQPQIDQSGKPILYVEQNPLAGGRTQASVVREYPWDRMSHIVRYERTDWLGRGYGIPEPEICLNYLATMALKEKFERNYLDENYIPVGILQIRGQMFENEEARQLLEMALLQGAGGPEAFWRLLTIFFTGDNANEGADFKPLRSATGGTSEIASLMQLNSEIRTMISAVYQIAPEELGFESHSTQSRALNEPSPESKFENSADKGFIPLMSFIEAKLNEDVVWRCDPDFRFAFVNLDPRNAQAEEELATKLMARGYTRNEIADEQDEARAKMPLLPNMWQRIADDLDEERFDTHDEWRAAVDKKYEKKFRALLAKMFQPQPAAQSPQIAQSVTASNPTLNPMLAKGGLFDGQAMHGDGAARGDGGAPGLSDALGVGDASGDKNTSGGAAPDAATLSAQDPQAMLSQMQPPAMPTQQPALDPELTLDILYELVSPWSEWTDAPINCPGGLQVWEQEKQPFQQIVQQLFSQALSPQSSSMVDGGAPPEMGEDGATEDENADTSEFDPNDPFGHGKPHGDEDDADYPGYDGVGDDGLGYGGANNAGGEASAMQSRSSDSNGGYDLPSSPLSPSAFGMGGAAGSPAMSALGKAIVSAQPLHLVFNSEYSQNEDSQNQDSISQSHTTL